MKKSLENEYFELLLQNSQNSLEDFIYRNGKEKAICPFIFVDRKEKEDNVDSRTV